MPAFNGSLRSNEIFSAIYNMIISQHIFSGNIKGTYGELADLCKVDGSLYGDTKLYYATDVLSSLPWTNDSEASNLLNLHRPAAPSCQKIVLDKFRQISLTVDNYLSKRAWSTADAFSTFNSVMLGWIRETKKIYDSTLINAFIGTNYSAAKRAIVESPVSTATTGLTGEEKNRVEAQTIAETMANLFVDMKDISRDFNDYKYLRSYDLADIVVIWNSKYVNKIKKVDLPTIFHKEGLIDKFEEKVLPQRYFGEIIGTNLANYSASTPTTGKPINSSTGAYTPGTGNVNGTVRTLIETTVTVSGTAYHLFPGDELPVGTTVGASLQMAAADVYFELGDVIAKVMHKRSVPFMSSFEVGTSFFNPKSLTENHYLTWGYNTLEHLLNYPFITVTED